MCSARPGPLDQPALLAAVLGVVARVGLVRDQVRQLAEPVRQVGVDRDPRAVVAQVVVEARPRLVGDDLVATVSTSGRPYWPRTRSRSALDSAWTAASQPVGRALLATAVRGVALGERAAAGQQRVELGVRGGVVGRVAEVDVDLEVAAHLVDEADRLAAHLPGGALQAGQLTAQEVGRSAGRSGGVSSRSRPRAWSRSCCGVGAGSSSTCGADPRVAGVGVDEAGLQPVEAQPQPDVLEGEVERLPCASLRTRAGHSRPPSVSSPKRRCRAA